MDTRRTYERISVQTLTAPTQSPSYHPNNTTHQTAIATNRVSRVADALWLWSGMQIRTVTIAFWVVVAVVRFGYMDEVGQPEER